MEKALMDMHYDIVLIKDKKASIVQAVALSCLSQVVLAVDFYLIAKGFHQDINLLYFLIFTPLVCVAASLPSIGGLGVREVGWVYLLAKVGVANDVALSLSLTGFFLMVIVGLIGGFVYVVTVSSGRVQHYQPSPAISPKKS